MARIENAQRPAPRARRGSEGAGFGSAAPLMVGIGGVALVLLLVMLGAIFVFQMIHSNTVYPGVRVGSVTVGGMSKERALAELKPVYEERTKKPLDLKIGGEKRTATLPELGASFDAGVAAEAAFRVGRSGNWFQRVGAQIGSLAGGYEVESPGINIDRPKLQSYLSQVARTFDRTVKDAELQVGADQSVKIVPSVVGRKLDVPAAGVAIEKALAAGSPDVDLPVAETKPKRVEQQLEEMQARLSKMFSGPVGLEFDGKKWTLSVKDIAGLVKIEDTSPTTPPSLSVQEASLVKLVDTIAGEVDQGKINARYDWNGGNLKLLKPGQDGRKVNRDKALADLKGALTAETRIVALPVDVEKAAGGSLDPSVLGIKERIEYGRTPIAGVAEKIHNVKLAASRLNGVLLAPGDTFSFNRELGPTTLKSGFQTGFAISSVNGDTQTIPSVAGGICQVATTLFQAVFWAGYQIEERYPHLYWIRSYGQPPRGMTGLDATVDDPALDFQFLNNSGNFLLIQSSVVDNQLEFALYGTKPTWKVDVEGPIITNVQKPDTAMVYQYEPSWPVGKRIQVETATDGMDVTIIRRVTQGGETRTLTVRSPYQAARNVTMVGGTKAQAEAAQEAAATPTPAATPAPSPSGETPAAPAGAAPSATPATSPSATTPLTTTVPAAATAKPAATTPPPAAATKPAVPGTPSPKPTSRP